jgi:zinc protease
LSEPATACCDRATSREQRDSLVARFSVIRKDYGNWFEGMMYFFMYHGFPDGTRSDLTLPPLDFQYSETTPSPMFEPAPANIDARTILRELPGGMRLALLPKKTRGGTVVAQLTLRWGDEQSKSGRSAACRLTSSMLMRGTKKHTREQLRDEFERLKASVDVDGEGASIETRRDYLPAVLRLVAEVLREPAFPASEFEQLKRSALTSIESQKSEPNALAGMQLARHLNPYPPEHWLYTPTLDERIERL